MHKLAIIDAAEREWNGAADVRARAPPRAASVALCGTSFVTLLGIYMATPSSYYVKYYSFWSLVMQIMFYATGFILLLTASDTTTRVYFGSMAPAVLAMTCSVALSVIIIIDYDYTALARISGPDSLCQGMHAGVLDPGRLMTEHVVVHLLPLFFAQLQCILYSRSLKVHGGTAIALAAAAVYPNIVYSMIYDVTEEYGDFPPLLVYSASCLAALASVAFCGLINT